MEQNYEEYTNSDHQRWSYLMKKLQPTLVNCNVEFKNGLEKLEMSHDKIPRFEELNEKLENLTGWQYEATDGPVSNVEFMKSLANKKFLATVNVRSEEELEFCKLPDIFHDVYGHAGMLANKNFGEFLETLGQICMKHQNNEGIVSFLSSIYWYTAEVGLVYESGDLKYYGGSIISSINEIDRVFNEASAKFPFDIGKVGSTPYDSYMVNDQYFIVKVLSDLNQYVDQLSGIIDEQFITFEKFR